MSGKMSAKIGRSLPQKAKQKKKKKENTPTSSDP